MIFFSRELLYIIIHKQTQSRANEIYDRHNHLPHYDDISRPFMYHYENSKAIQKHVVEIEICNYVSRKLRIALNILNVNK